MWHGSMSVRNMQNRLVIRQPGVIAPGLKMAGCVIENGHPLPHQKWNLDHVSEYYGIKKKMCYIINYNYYVLFTN